MEKRALSPSRQYVAMCNKTNFDGFYFRRFEIPEDQGDVDPGWYFLNRVDFSACLEKWITAEDFEDVKDSNQPFRVLMLKFGPVFDKIPSNPIKVRCHEVRIEHGSSETKA